MYTNRKIISLIMNDQRASHDVVPSSKDERSATYIVCNMHINGDTCSKFWHNSRALVFIFASTRFRNSSSTEWLSGYDEDVYISITGISIFFYIILSYINYISIKRQSKWEAESVINIIFIDMHR